MGYGIGIPAGYGIKQQQLQDLDLVKIVQPLQKKPPPEPLPVSLVGESRRRRPTALGADGNYGPLQRHDVTRANL